MSTRETLTADALEDALMEDALEDEETPAPVAGIPAARRHDGHAWKTRYSEADDGDGETFDQCQKCHCLGSDAEADEPCPDTRPDPLCMPASEALPPDVVAPIVCESCAEVGLLEGMTTRRLTTAELAAVKESPAWRDFIEPALALINAERAKRS